jgi:hypothetical protein
MEVEKKVVGAARACVPSGATHWDVLGAMQKSVEEEMR